MNSLKSKKDWQWPAMWFLLVLTIVFGLITASGLISNSTEAKRRYDILMAADKAGGDVEKELLSLRNYIYAHMNTTIGAPNGIKPPIQLKGTYDRLAGAANKKVADANKQLYAEAQSYCEQRFPQGTLQSGRVPCVSDYVSARGVEVQPVSEALYKFDFVSPLWSPDLAGWALIATAVAGFWFIVLLLWHRRIRHHIHEAS